VDRTPADCRGPTTEVKPSLRPIPAAAAVLAIKRPLTLVGRTASESLMLEFPERSVQEQDTHAPTRVTRASQEALLCPGHGDAMR
jgi:hypothetical protein